MPWACPECRANVPDSAARCPKCSREKSAWTLTPDKTRNFVLTRAKFELLRGEVSAVTRQGQRLYDPYALVKATVARVIPKTAAARLFERAEQPASLDVLVVRLYPKGEMGKVKLGIDFTSNEMLEQAFEVPESPFVDVPFLFIAGPESMPSDFSLPGLNVVDLTEDSEEGFAPELEFSALNRPTVELSTMFVSPETPALPQAAVRVIPGGCFAFDSSFPGAGVAEVLRDAAFALEEEDEQGPLQRIAVFGHTDSAGSDAYNKGLSDRRARAILALLRSDLAAFDAVAAEEDWGPAVYQAMLRAFTSNPGAIDGQPGAMTTAALRGFARAYDEGLFHPDADRPRAHGKLGAASSLSEAVKAALRDAYVTEYGVELPAAGFVGPAESPSCAGCSEFNPGGAEEAQRRRVTLGVFPRDEAPAPTDFPCRAGDVSACALDDGTPQQRCRVYREMIGADEPLEPEQITAFFDHEWRRTPTGNVHVSCLTPLPDSDDLTITVLRWTADGSPREIDSKGPGDAPPDVGPEVASLPGLIRHGVAYALYKDVDTFDPLELGQWFLDDEDSTFAPPVFRVEQGEHWAISSPPGWRFDGVRFDQSPGDRPVVALTSAGKLVFATSAADLGRADGKAISVRVPGASVSLPEKE